MEIIATAIVLGLAFLFGCSALGAALTLAGVAAVAWIWLANYLGMLASTIIVGVPAALFVYSEVRAALR